jgi:cell wall-associated NlpC family hydrolase
MFLDLPYLWGGRSGFAVDCSGLTSAVYEAHGVTIPRDAGAQALHGHGERVGDDDLAPGDLLFYGAGPDTGPIHHVTMYAGGGQMIEASGSAASVRITAVRPGDGYWGAVRFLRSR